LVAACCALGVGLAQPPDADDRPPLPPDEPARPSIQAQVRFPNPTRRMFGGIEDDKPVRSEKQNPDEYQAWTEVILTAKQHEAVALEEAAARDLTPDDLLKANARRYFRLELVRFDGTLTKLRRVEATKALQDSGVAVVYEGWIVPDAESKANPVVAVVTDLPPGLEPAAELDRRVSFAGYFFKTMAYPGPDFNKDLDKDEGGRGWLTAPLLVGRSITPRNEPFAPDVKLDKNLRIFRMIRDDAPMATAHTSREEAAAWNRVLLHARQFSVEDLEAAARRDVEFHNLFKDVRRDYKLDLVYFEGTLIRLAKMEPSARMREAGVNTAYEGWLVPKDEPRGNPVCVVFTDLPDDVPLPEKPTAINKWVSFAGYSFKLMRYESAERSKKVEGEFQWKAAPLLLGRGVLTKPDPRRDSPVTWGGGFVPGAVAVIGGMVSVALLLTWVFRRGDKKARREIEANRQNPFAAGA
jgi:hypothetical protein